MGGIGIIVLFLLGTLLAASGSAAMSSSVALLTRGRSGSAAVVRLARLLPFGWLAWLVITLIIAVLMPPDRDFGVGDEWFCALPNGYVVDMIDVTDRGSLARLGEENSELHNVVALHVSGPWIFAEIDNQKQADSGAYRSSSGYVEIDAKSGKQTMLQNLQTLKYRALERGTVLQLRPIYEVYSHCREAWYDPYLWIVYFLPPLISFVVLCFRTWTVRRQPTAVPIILN